MFLRPINHGKNFAHFSSSFSYTCIFNLNIIDRINFNNFNNSISIELYGSLVLKRSFKQEKTYNKLTN